MKCREYKYISLGGSCVAMPLLGDLRIKGPIDNMKANMGFESCLSLFSDFEYFKSNLLQNTIIRKIKLPYSDLTTEVELSKGIGELLLIFRSIASIYNQILECSLSVFDLENLNT